MDEFLKFWPVLLWLIPFVATGGYAWATLKGRVELHRQLNESNHECLILRVAALEARDDKVLVELQAIEKAVVKLQTILEERVKVI